MASRIAKSLVPPEQGYRHREHRSKKGRVVGLKHRRIAKKLKLRKLEGKKGKWIE